MTLEITTVHSTQDISASAEDIVDEIPMQAKEMQATSRHRPATIVPRAASPSCRSMLPMTQPPPKPLQPKSDQPA